MSYRTYILEKELAEVQEDLNIMTDILAQIVLKHHLYNEFNWQRRLCEDVGGVSDNVKKTFDKYFEMAKVQRSKDCEAEAEWRQQEYEDYLQEVDEEERRKQG